MELRWREAWKRALIELGYREGLTCAQLARRGNVSSRSVRRWWKEYCRDGVAQTIAVSSFPPAPPFQIQFPRAEPAPAVTAAPPQVPPSGPASALDAPLLPAPVIEPRHAPAQVLTAPEMGFAEVTEASATKPEQIRIDLAEGGRVVIEGVFNVQTLSRLIAAMRQC